jgi:hypothetical protein
MSESASEPESPKADAEINSAPTTAGASTRTARGSFFTTTELSEAALELDAGARAREQAGVRRGCCCVDGSGGRSRLFFLLGLGKSASGGESGDGQGGQELGHIRVPQVGL